MTLTSSTLTRAAGIAAVLAGVLFIFIQPVHPAEELATVTSTAWVVVGAMTMGFAVLGLAGVTGIYLRQVEEAGILGLVGYLLLACFFLLATAFTFAETFVLPPLASEAPRFVDGFLGIFAGSPSDVDLGVLGAMSLVSFGLYLPGGLLFGLALWRARVVHRWAGLTMALAALSTLLVPALPHTLGRYAAVPFGVALAWLGWSLWAERHDDVPTPSKDTTTARLDLTTAE